MGKLIERAQRILMTPRTEWPVIAAEPDTAAGLYTRYILVLAAIGPLAMLLMGAVIGASLPFGGMLGARFGFGWAIVQYVLALVMTYVFALIVNALAPTFGGQKDMVQALKAVAYSMTAGWVASAALLIPILGGLIAFAGYVYSIYLLYLGLPVTMKAPAERAGGYTAVSVIVALVAGWILWAIIGALFWRGAFGGYGVFGAAPPQSREEAALEKWAKQIEEAGEKLEQSVEAEGVPPGEAVGQFVGAIVGGAKGAVEALPTDRLRAFVPETLSGLPRTSISAERSGAIGLQVSNATASYSDGAGRDLKLEITDTGGAQGFVALAAWANVEQEREWDGGFERNYRDGDRMVHEQWDASNGYGEYAVIVGKRFAVEVSGRAGHVDELKAALATGVDLRALEAEAARKGT